MPLYALNQVDARRCEWLVPGMLKEKTQLLLKSLPQKLRRHCVPLPEFAAGFVERHGGPRFGAGGLLESLIADIREQTQIAMKQSDFKLETLPAHLFMNFKVIDEHGRQLAMGRNLSQLRAELGGQAQQHFQKIASSAAGAALADAGGGGGVAAARKRGIGAARRRRGAASRGKGAAASGPLSASQDGRRRKAPRCTKSSRRGTSASCPSCSKSAVADRRCSAIRRSSIAARIATSKCSIRPRKPRGFIARVCGDCSRCN